MIRHHFLIFFTLLLFYEEGNAQSSPINTPAIFKHLLKQQKNIPVITGSFLEPSKFRILSKNEMPKKLWQENQYLVYTSGKLFLGINGTGRLYEIKNQNDSLHFIREDSTFFLGNNFNSANFSIGDTIYSYGGYGFWKNNGLLKYYNKIVHEWELIKTDQELASSFCTECNASNFWIDIHHGRFYLAGQRIVNDGLKSESNLSVQKNKNLFVLNIAKGEWTELGVLVDEPVTFPLNSPYGLLYISPFNSYINDYIDNRKLVAKKTAMDKIKKMLTGYQPDVAYFIDSTLYFGNISLNSFDSLQISKNDFEYKGEQVYIPLSVQTNFSGSTLNRIMWSAIALFALVLSYILFKFWNRNKIEKKHNAPIYSETNLPPIQKFNGKNGNQGPKHIFNEIEKVLILFIYDKTTHEFTVNVEEINKVLGLSGKNESVQKKNRSETINDINKKWAVLHNNNNPLILRQRSEFDKRSFEYFIQPVWLEKVNEMLPRLIK